MYPIARDAAVTARVSHDCCTKTIDLAGAEHKNFWFKCRGVYCCPKKGLVVFLFPVAS
jgi:hypothetical protein